MSKSEMKRFQRSPYLSSECAHTQSLPQISLEHKQGTKGRDFDTKNYHLACLEGNEASVLFKLSELEDLIKIERYQRLKENDRMISMIKEMECKHSSIIYNSEIRYCKSPPKPEIFFAQGFKNKANTLQKSSSAYSLNPQKENMNSQLNLKASRATIELCAEKVKNSQRVNKLNECGTNRYNLGKESELIQKKQDINRNSSSNQSLKKMKGQIQQGLKEKIDTLSKELLSKVKSTQDNLDETLFKHSIHQESQFKNLHALINHLKMEIEGIKKDNLFISQNLAQGCKQIQEKTKGLISSIHINSSEKLSKIQQTFSQFKCQFKLNIENMCDILNEQSTQIKKLDDLSGLNHNIYSNKIHEIFQFLNSKMSAYEKEMHRSESLQKESQADKQKRRQAIVKSIEETISNKSDISKIMLEKLLWERCQRIEDGLGVVLERHIQHVEDYIRKNIEKEDIIMKKYCIS